MACVQINIQGGRKKTKVTIIDSFSLVDLEAENRVAGLKSKESVKLIGNGPFGCQRNKNQKIKNDPRENVFPVIAFWKPADHFGEVSAQKSQ